MVAKRHKTLKNLHFCIISWIKHLKTAFFVVLSGLNTKKSAFFVLLPGLNYKIEGPWLQKDIKLPMSRCLRKF